MARTARYRMSSNCPDSSGRKLSSAWKAASCSLGKLKPNSATSGPIVNVQCRHSATLNRGSAVSEPVSLPTRAELAAGPCLQGAVVPHGFTQQFAGAKGLEADGAHPLRSWRWLGYSPKAGILSPSRGRSVSAILRKTSVP
jgi:hypothetical protein